MSIFKRDESYKDNSWADTAIQERSERIEAFYAAEIEKRLENMTVDAKSLMIQYMEIVRNSRNMPVGEVRGKTDDLIISALAFIMDRLPE